MLPTNPRPSGLLRKSNKHRRSPWVWIAGAALLIQSLAMLIEALSPILVALIESTI